MCQGRSGEVTSVSGASEVFFVGIVVGGNFVCCLIIVVVFMGFGGARKSRDTLKSSFGVAREDRNGGTSFMGKGGGWFLNI